MRRVWKLHLCPVGTLTALIRVNCALPTNHKSSMRASVAPIRMRSVLQSVDVTPGKALQGSAAPKTRSHSAQNSGARTCALIHLCIACLVRGAVAVSRFIASLQGAAQGHGK